MTVIKFFKQVTYIIHQGQLTLTLRENAAFTLVYYLHPAFISQKDYIL